MPVETDLEFISDLVPDTPNGNEKISEGDDHIRNIKKAIVKTFPEVKGKVSVNQDELNNLSGLVENVQDALPEAPTVDGSVIHNNGSRWAETNTLEIKGDKAFIPAFSGMGNLVLYVDDSGEIKAADMATTPEIQHPLNAHTDVDYPTDPKEDDILIFNGTEWVNTPNRTGNMFKPFNQPNSVGTGFTMNGNQRWDSSTKDGSGFFNFKVPSGMRFALVSISEGSSSSGAGVDPKVIIDGVDMNSLKRYSKSWPTWSAAEGLAGPNIEVKEEIKVKWGGTESSMNIVGYFFEV